MRPKAFIALALVTAVVTVAAVAAVAARHWGERTIEEVEPFPGLLERFGDVAQVTVRKSDGALTLSREGGDRWSLMEKHDYSAEGDKVSKALADIAQLRLTEPKTRIPERYPRLGVADVDRDGADSKLVTFQTAEGEELAELLVGRSAKGVGQTGTYVRLPGEERAWLAEPPLDIPGDPVAWLEKRIIHVAPKRVARFATVQPDGEKLVVYKNSPEDAHFMFEDLPADTILKGESVADETPSVLFAVELADVRPEDEIDFTGDVTRAEVKTFDGLVVEAETTEVDGAVWARFRASSAEPYDLDPEVAAEADLLAPEEVAAEVEEINARLGGWAYRLNEWQAGKLRAKLADFLEKEVREPSRPMGSPPAGLFPPGQGMPGG